VIGLVDADNFYSSVECLMRPQLRGRPVCVMSSNDGNVIARSREAKLLGIRMGQPVFEVQPLVRSHNVVLCSANFALYGDLSRRMTAVLREELDTVENYSIDEIFASWPRVSDVEGFSRSLRDRVRRHVGLSVTIGTGPSKTLAKCGVERGKKIGGVCDVSDIGMRQSVLAELPVTDDIGIETAAQLRDAPVGLILDRFGSVLARTQRELQGLSCLSIEEVEPDRKQLMVSRSFGERVEDHDAVLQAIATFAVRATEKLRKRGLVAAGVMFFAGTDPFRPELRQHHPSRSATLMPATSDTRAVLASMRGVMHGFLRSGCAYKRAGVALLDLARPASVQRDLFAPAVIAADPLMQAVDAINRRFGSGSVGFGATGWDKSARWHTRQRNLSPCYTTRWADLPLARC
jgi:DNA polymerase V